MDKYVCMYVFMYVCIYVCMYLCMYVYKQDALFYTVEQLDTGGLRLELTSPQ